MQTTISQSFSRRGTAAALLAGSAALLMLGLQPILLGELVTAGVVTMEGVGLVAMGEIMALGAGVALGDALLPVARYRAILALAALATAALDLGSCGASGDAGLALWRAAAGLAEGVQLWAATAVIVRAAGPDRLAALFMVAQTVSQSAAAGWLAWRVVPAGGWQGGFRALALLALLPLACAPLLPPRLQPLRASAAGKFAWSAAAVLALAAAFMQMAAIGALWAYLEPLGLAAGLDARGVQSLVSACLLTQVAGGVAAVALVRRVALAGALGGGLAALLAVCCALYLLPAGHPGAFALLCAVFGFLWLFLMPFHIALAFRADPGGSLAMLVPAAQLLGSAFGPLVASIAISGDDAAPVPLASACFAAAAFTALALALAAPQRRTA